jgi:hypothetical protein
VRARVAAPGFFASTHGSRAAALRDVVGRDAIREIAQNGIDAQSRAPWRMSIRVGGSPTPHRMDKPNRTRAGRARRAPGASGAGLLSGRVAGPSPYERRS